MSASKQLRRAMKSAAAGIFTYTGLRKAMTAVRRRSAGGRRVLIVSYHRVVEDFTGELQRSIPGLLISSETFQRHLDEAHAAGFEFATIGDALEVLSGQKAAQKDLMVITFDDGYRDVYRHGFPILQRMGVPFIQYLPAKMVGTDRRFHHDRLFHLIQVIRRQHRKIIYDALTPAAASLLVPILAGKKSASAALDEFIGEYRSQALSDVIDSLERHLGGGADLVPEQGDLMSWDEVRTMARAGMEVGAHTLEHVVLPLEDRATIHREILESRQLIEREVGSPVQDFAYCNGWYSTEVIGALAQHGFRSAVTTEDLPNRMGGDPYTLKRKVLWENFSIGLDGAYSSLLTQCQFDDLYGMLGASSPVMGRRDSHAP